MEQLPVALTTPPRAAFDLTTMGPIVAGGLLPLALLALFVLARRRRRVAKAA
jgi:hypothetical protein